MGPSDRRHRNADRVDPFAFGAVFDEHFDAIFAYFARRTNRADAAELASETFRLAFAAWSTFDASCASARPWLFGFARNVLRHHRRSSAREANALRRLVAVPLAEVDAELLCDASIDAANRWPAVAAALARLADFDREVLLLLAWDDLTYAEIARVTDVPIGTVRSRINRARRQVRELIGDDGQQGIDTHRCVPEEADHG